jgi:non-heme chloroperoxidase
MQRRQVLASAAPQLRPAMIEAADGTRLSYRDWGAGRPVVLVHSWGVTADMWDYQIPALLDHGLRCVAFDRRGHGRSAEPGRGYDPDTLADDLGAVMEQLDLREAVLVGHSMGGGEIVRYLSRHGDVRVAKVVLLAATTPFLTRTEDNPSGVDAAAFEAGRAIWRQDFAQWVADNTDPFFTPDTSAPMKAWLARMLLRTPLPVLLECNRVVTETDFRPDLRAIEVPTLVIHGDQDASAPLELTGRPSAALVAGARLEVYEGAPHGLFVTHMERLNADLAAFARA